MDEAGEIAEGDIARDEDFDVVVVGAGVSDLIAALKAADMGANGFVITPTDEGPSTNGFPALMEAWVRPEDYAYSSWWNPGWGTTGDGHMMGLAAELDRYASFFEGGKDEDFAKVNPR